VRERRQSGRVANNGPDAPRGSYDFFLKSRELLNGTFAGPGRIRRKIARNHVISCTARPVRLGAQSVAITEAAVACRSTFLVNATGMKPFTCGRYNWTTDRCRGRGLSVDQF